MVSLARLVVVPLLAVLLGPAPEVRGQGFADDSGFAHLWVPLEGTRPAQWRVVWHTDPCTRATISWSTREAGSRHRVHLERADDAGAARTVAAVSGAYAPGADEGTEPLGHYHHARLEGLEPGTRYRFRLESDGELSPPLWFETAPAGGTDFEVLYGGDSRTGWRDRCRVNLLVARLAGERPRLTCFVHGGDYVTDGDSSAQWLRWLSHHELTTAADGRVLPIVPARGNHDHGPCYGEVFDAPGTGGGAWFRTDLGADVALLNLDTNASVLGDQLHWIGRELPEARAGARFVLVNYHRPMFPAVKTPAAAAPYWVPLFERHRVDLVLESDGHCMKRTPPILDGRVDPEGVVYLGEGGLGVPQRKPDADRWYLGRGAFVGRGHHVSLLSFSEQAIETRFLVLTDAEGLLEGAAALVPRGVTWAYREGPGEPDWIRPEHDDSDWLRGPAGFGYGDDDDATVLEDMRHRTDQLLIRTEFELEAPFDAQLVPVLAVDYDDGFVAYLNGVEVARSGVHAGGVVDHEAGAFELFELAGARSLLRVGTNVLAVSGHNVSVSSSDFTLHPSLVLLPRGAAGPGAVAYRVEDVHRVPVRPRRAGR